MMPQRATVARVARYGVSGLLSAGTHFGTTALIVELVSIRPSVATNVGFGLSVVVSYLLQRDWVFRSSRAHRTAFPRFLTVVTISGTVNFAIMVVGVELMGFGYLIVQALAIAVIPLINYLLNSTWTFPSPVRD